MGLKASKYNCFSALGGSGVAAYNSLYRSLLILSAREHEEALDFFERLRSSQEVQAKTEIELALRDHRFVIDVAFDELEFLKFGYFRSLYGGTTLTTMVLPTLACNFDCPYCFERKSGATMSDQTADAYLAWVGGKLRQKKHFHITWFGGEPLLCLYRIKSLTSRAREMCSASNCGYSAAITTNGYLLQGETIDELHELSVDNVHVTLDGAADDHDRYRFTRGGAGTFSQIRSNIEEYCERTKSHLPLHIRVNVTDDNFNRIPSLFAEFSAKVQQRSSFYFRYVWSSRAAGYKKFATKSESPKAFETLSGLYRCASDAGFRIENPIDPISFNYCEVDYVDHFAIDPLGNIYLCGHLYCPEEAIGNVGEPISEAKIAEYCKWINTNPFSDPECLACVALPLCRGGCRKSRFLGKRSCIEEKDGLDSYIQVLAKKHAEAEVEEASQTQTI